MKNNLKHLAYVLAVTACYIIGLNSMARASSEHASLVAQQDSACVSIQPFYWEIGTATGLVVSGQSGGNKYDASTVVPIASASKFVFGAFVLQARQGQLTPFDIKSLEMSSGYTNYKTCLITPYETVNSCLARQSKPIYVFQDDGKFHYSGGPFEVWGYQNSLGPMNSSGLNGVYKTYLGNDLGMSFFDPGFAGSLKGSASSYAGFLMKILRGKLIISRFLGTYPICTNPSTCLTAVASPVPYSWHYSLGHWIEDDPSRPLDDGAFSSPGMFGFYPWISSNKKFYGVLTRVDKSPQAYLKSVDCGQRIRKAFFAP